MIVSKSNLKLKLSALFRAVRTLIIKIFSSEEPANYTSIHRVRNARKLSILFYLSSKNITKRWRIRASVLKTVMNGAELAKFFYYSCACAEKMPLCSHSLSSFHLWQRGCCLLSFCSLSLSYFLGAIAAVPLRLSKNTTNSVVWF